MKTILTTGVIATLLGAGLTALFFVISGMQYRLAEDAGIEPGETPAYVTLGITIGVFVTLTGSLALVSAAAIATEKNIVYE